jgi:hypothetical protein
VFTAMILCPYCQAQNADGATYCVRCGQAVGTAPARGGAVATGGRPAPMGEGDRKGLAITSLVFGILSIPTLGCLGVGAIVAIVCGIIALNKTKSEPGVYGGRGMAIGGIVTGALSFVMLPIVGVVAAIAIPSLLRARVSGNESATIGDIRSVISGEVAYQAANGGYYDTLECLGTPANCIPNYSGPTFLDPVIASGIPKSGYRRTMHLGPPPDSAPEGAPISPSSVTSYAYVAVPMNRGQTGVRGFCGDANGIICYTVDGSEPDVADGACVVGRGCTPLR